VTIDEVLAEFKIKPEDVMCGAHCGDGWAPIVRDLFHDLISLGWDRDLHQVKEKFGKLRVYVGVATDEIYERIRQAEIASSHLCEDCGNIGWNNNWDGFWFRTLCAECGEKWVTKFS